MRDRLAEVAPWLRPGRATVVGLLVTALLATTGAAADDQAPSPADLSVVAFLSGIWQHEQDGTFVEEVWTAPRGDLMLGTHRTVRPGKATQWEHLRLVVENGEVVYWASPGGAAPTPFRLVESGAGRAVFTNPDHDFPQRLAYERHGDQLVARVEAQRDGQWSGFELRWTLAAEVP